MTTNGGDMIADILKSHGVDLLFTLCGGHISPILVGCRKAGIRVIDVRDEVNAVFAADAVARLTGTAGVAAVTAGPGVTNTITALKNAQMAQSPLVLIGGSAATVIKGRGSLQDIDQIALLDAIVKSAVSINRNCDIIPAMAQAFQTAGSGIPGPVFVECPIDLLYSEDLVREWYGAKAGDENHTGLKSKLFQFYLNRHVNRMFACDLDDATPETNAPHIPEIKPAGLEKAVSAVSESTRPVLIIGSQALLDPTGAKTLADAVARIGMPVYLTGMARGLMGPGHPLQMRHKRKNALKHADLVILAGMPCDFRLGYGRAINAKARLIGVNRSKKDLTLNRKPDIALLGDPALFIRGLAERIPPSPTPWQEWIDALRNTDNERENEIEKMGQVETGGVNPIQFLKQLDAFIADKSVIIADGGDFVATASYILRPRGPLTWLDPGVFGTLGVGAGFATGAALCKPDHEIWLVYGDGAAGYSLQEFDTFVRHGLPVIAVVGNDASWAQIARDQVVVLKDDVGTVLRKTAYHTVAEGFGGKGILVKTEAEIPEALENARCFAQAGSPVLINVHIGRTDFRKGSISM